LTCDSTTKGLLFLALEKLGYKTPPYSVHYPELITIESGHPCVPALNDISGNVYCHRNSMNVSGRSRGFISADCDSSCTAVKVVGWFFTMPNKHEKCRAVCTHHHPSPFSRMQCRLSSL
jgi:hypothetical protein